MPLLALSDLQLEPTRSPNRASDLVEPHLSPNLPKRTNYSTMQVSVKPL